MAALYQESESHSQWVHQALIITKLKHRIVKEPESRVVLMPFINTPIIIDRCRRWLENPHVRRFLHPNTPWTTDSGRTETYQDFVAFMSKSPHHAYFQIIDNKNDAYRRPNLNYGAIGLASLNGIDYNALTFNRGIVIGEPHLWHQGIAAEVGLLLLGLAKSVGFRQAKATANVENIASVKNLRRQFGPGKSRYPRPFVATQWRGTWEPNSSFAWPESWFC
ncbi:MAG: hypothetical protein G01um101416_132 [Microgenomates group bacterium Gr01-1014_16]|nr:MAG: hypothetical protein G01um101416_132 [Microgenomates group bacterium Gr01-1014_16]